MNKRRVLAHITTLLSIYPSGTESPTVAVQGDKSFWRPGVTPTVVSPFDPVHSSQTARQMRLRFRSHVTIFRPTHGQAFNGQHV